MTRVSGSRPIVSQYQHEAGRERAAEALEMLQGVALVVKPVMKQRGWRLSVLGEMPSHKYLLGLHASWGLGWGQKVFLRLRDWGDENQLFPFEDVVDTMLHE